MITNFEELTFELTEKEEITIIPILIEILKDREGKLKAVKNTRIISILNSKGIKIHAPRVRKLIQYIRINGIIERLIGSKNGYYISNDEKELKEYIESLMQRANSISIMARQLNYQLKNLD